MLFGAVLLPVIIDMSFVGIDIPFPSKITSEGSILLTLDLLKDFQGVTIVVNSPSQFPCL